MRRKLEQYNEAMRSTSVDGVLGSTLVRIFNQTFERGGRFYAQGNSYQNMPREQRRLITIDGEQVGEVDFKTLHPSFLYGQEKCAAPNDAYDIDGYARQLVKQALLVLINAKSKIAAIRSIASNDLIGNMATPNSPEAFEITRRLLDEIKRVHKPIAKYFHSDMGAHLMHLDSLLAEAVMHKMLEQGQVVLPVHDSFLVPESKIGILQEAMAFAAHDLGYPDLKTEIA